MGGDAVGCGCTSIYRRTDQRMPEGENTVSDTDKTGSLSRFKVVESQSYSRNGVEHHTEFAGVLGRRHQQRQSGFPRQPVHLGTERVEYPARSGGQPRPDGWAVRRRRDHPRAPRRPIR